VVFAVAISVFTLSGAGSGLVVQINPEIHLDTPVVPLSFAVDNPGEIAVNQPVTITAWVRSLPDRQIRLTARTATLNGPAGAAPTGAIRWSGSMATATGGATTAVCTSGDFSAGGPQQLIGNWTQSGIAKCTVTFALATDSGWVPGAYTGEVDLSLSTQ